VNIEPGMIYQYLAMLFEDGEKGYIALRGLGEKRTDKEGVFQEMLWISLQDIHIQEKVNECCARWAEHKVAAFIIPAIMRSDTRGSSQDVLAFTTICMDFDSGDTFKKLKHVENFIGKATMVIASGGKIDEDNSKLHAYWKLSELEDDIGAVSEVRHRLAGLAGGDFMFGRGRAHQPIRIAGSIHNKGGDNPKRVTILRYEDNLVYHFQDIQDSVMSMTDMKGQPFQDKTTDLLDFSKPINQLQNVNETLLTKVHEGSETINNRWTTFSQVAGHYIAMSNEGKCTVDAAFDYVMGWMQSNMVPPWPVERARNEFNALLKRDLEQRIEFDVKKAEIPNVSGQGLESWAVTNWTQGDPPPRKFLVDKLVPLGIPMLFVSEGGGGKTFSLIDLALKAASYTPDANYMWMGQSLMQHCNGETVVMITAEDDKDELHRRIVDCDPENLRHKAGNRLIILPLVNAGGSFPFVHYTRTGLPEPSPKWQTLLNELERLQPKLVILDTLNSSLHGDESSASIIQDWFRVVVGKICGDIGATVLISHHIRKGGDISTSEEMRDAVRGSTAILNSVRAAIGFWVPKNYIKRLKAMGEEPAKVKLFLFGVLKANNPEMFRGTKTLLRQKNGLLNDVTHSDIVSTNFTGRAVKQAWLVFAIEKAVLAGHPYKRTSTTGGLFVLKDTLPKQLRLMTKEVLHDLSLELIESKHIVLAKATSRGASTYLDVPGGMLTKGLCEFEIGNFSFNWDDYYYNQTEEKIIQKGY